MRRPPATRPAVMLPAVLLPAVLVALSVNASALADANCLAVARRAGIVASTGAFAPSPAPLTLTLAQSTEDTPPAPQPADDVLKDVPNYGQMLTTMLVALGAIVVVLLVAAKLLPKVMGQRFASRAGAAGGATKLIEIVETRRLDPRTSIHLVKVAGQYFLIGTTGDRVQTLAGGELDSEAVATALRAVDTNKARKIEQGAVQSKPFADVLKHTDASEQV